MKRTKPSCYGKCQDCFFYFIDGCVALSGEDCFLEINQKKAELILKNRNRFNISSEAAISIAEKFPGIHNVKEMA